MNPIYSTKPKKSRALPIMLVLLLPLAFAACSSDSDDADDDMQDMNPTPPMGQDEPGEFSRTTIGDVLVFGDQNRTLYTFANDAADTSNCNDDCALTWPPLAATEAAAVGNFTTITRADATLQWAYKGSPLYYYQGDAAEGDVAGDGINDIWYVARPDPVIAGSTNLGNILVAQGTINNGGGDAASRTDYNGYTLYTFVSDSPNVSVCNDQCAVVWPPLYADKGAVAANGYSIITRDDGSAQWAYNESALYFYQADSAPGDTNGEAVNGLWFVVAAP